MPHSITISAGHRDWYSVTLTPLQHPETSAVSMSFHHTEVNSDLTFQSAADYTSKLIADRCPNLYLAMSGGLDSEFVAEVLYRNGISFTPIVALTPDNVEPHCALHWCKLHNLDPVIITFTENDPRLIRQFRLIAKELKQASGLTNIVAYLAEYVSQLGGQLLVGDSPFGGPTDSYYQPSGEIFEIDWYSFIVEFMQPNTHPGAFFQYTPELFLAKAKSLNISISESAGKAELYEIPFKPKDPNPALPISLAVSKQLAEFAGIGMYSFFPPLTWHRDELIKLLSK